MVGFKKRFLSLVSALAISGALYAQIDVRGELDRRLQQGDFQGAQVYLRDHGGTVEDQILLHADIAVAKGNFGEAIKIYRDLVAKFPDVIFLRIKLAQLLELNGSTQSAIFQYNELLRRDGNIEGQNYYQTRISALKATKNFGTSMNASLTPSSNINNASSLTTGSFFGIEYPLPKEFLPQVGWRANLGISAFARSQVADHQEFVLYGRVNLDRYTVKTIDRSDAEIGLSWNYRTARNSFSLTPYVTKNIGDGEIYQTAGSFKSPIAQIVSKDEDSWVRGLRMSFERRFSQGRSLFFSAQVSDEVFDDQKNLGYSDNTSWSGKIGGTWMINNRNRASMWVGVSRYDQIGPRDDYRSQNNYNGKSTGIRLETIWKNGFQTDFSTQIGDRKYQLEHILLGEKREDELFEISAGISNQNWQIGKFIPKLDCSYNVNSSNIAELESKGGGCGMSLTQNF